MQKTSHSKQLRYESFGCKSCCQAFVQQPQHAFSEAFLLYFLSGLRNGFHGIGFRNLQELHDGLEKETLRMVPRLTFGALVSMKWYFPKIGEPQYRPQNIIVLTIRIPKKVPLILGNP